MTHIHNSPAAAGFGLIDTMIGISVVTIAVLGTAGGLTTGIRMATDARESNRANDAAFSVIEEFRESCKSDFTAAIGTFNDRKTQLGDVAVRSQIVLSETRFQPALDLNGDGDTLDESLTADEVTAAYVQATVFFNNRTYTFVNLVSRADIDAGTSSTTDESTTPTDPGTTGTTGTTQPTDPVPAESDLPITKGTVAGEKIADFRFLNELGGMTVVGVSIDSLMDVYTNEIKFNGAVVFKNLEDPGKTGEVLPVTPFTLKVGENKFDHIKFWDAAYEKAVIDGGRFSVTLHYESGETTTLVAE